MSLPSCLRYQWPMRHSGLSQAALSYSGFVIDCLKSPSTIDLREPANRKKAGFFCDCADSLLQDSTCPFRRTEGQLQVGARTENATFALSARFNAMESRCRKEPN
jgi:hypothetical protein